MRDLAQIENIKIVQRLRMGKSCELYEVEFLRDTAKRGVLVYFLCHHKAISQRRCCVLSEVGDVSVYC